MELKPSKVPELNRRTLLASGGAASVAALSMVSQARAQTTTQPPVGEEPLTSAQTATRRTSASAPEFKSGARQG